MSAGSTYLRCVCAALILFWAAHTATGQTVVSVSPQTQYATEGVPFSVAAMITSVVNLNLYHIVLTFDNTLVRYDGISRGTFFAGPTLPMFTAPGAGVSTAVADEALIQQGTQSGSGLLFTINFTALQTGTTPVTIAVSSALRDGNNQPISFLSEPGVVIVEAAVPVQLTTFTGTVLPGRQVLLEWKTVSEINNFGFEVQRSMEAGGSFRTLNGGFLPGHGTTLVPQQYSYVDSLPGGGTLYYRLLQIDLDRTAHASQTIQVGNVASVAVTEPVSFMLEQNYPNPFNPTTVVSYQLPVVSNVKLVVSDMLGREVEVLVDERKEPGSYSVEFNAIGLASGVYFYRMQVRPLDSVQGRDSRSGAGGFVQTRRFLLLK